MDCGFLLLHKRNSFWNVVDARDVFVVSKQITQITSFDGFAQAVDVEGKSETSTGYSRRLGTFEVGRELFLKFKN